MATVKGNFLKGMLGPVITKELNGQQVITSKGRNPKQTEGTKAAAKTFGMASTLRRHITECFSFNLMGLKDSDQHSRMNKIMNTSLSGARHPLTKEFHFEKETFQNLKGFEFNLGLLANDQMNIKPVVHIDDGTLQVSFPDWELPSRLKWIKKSTYCIMTFTVVLCRLGDGLIARLPEMQSVRLEKGTDDVLNGRSFTFNAPEGCLCITSVFLQYFDSFRMLNNEKMSPAAICDAIVLKGTYAEETERLWMNMNIKY
ncbi:hypothetical protein [Pedobacter sp. MR2016-24]|uniref:hypothetical protein n=1 Tax=Pedobacter sp. MR2016-24 TaxID=2994466 RepID=UPI00224670AD|nr:hypothetical protein [Pedobacter sp. MR2016-24]MCX2486518.1 hypothetical protein [Pedobacter sp. MR2016-24]